MTRRKGISEKRKRFVTAYLGPAKGNSTQAARMAGFSRKTATAAGSRLLTFVDVQMELQKQRKNLERAATLTMVEAQEYLADAVRAESDRRSDRNKALELYLRTQGAFTDKHVIGASGDLLELLNSIKGTE